MLVTDDPGDIWWSGEVSVAFDIFGNVHVAWTDQDLDGSGIDNDIFYRMWNATTGIWSQTALLTDDNINNTEPSAGSDVETDSFGNVHVVWQESSDLDGSGPDSDIFWRMWNATTGVWHSRLLISDDANNTGGSREPKLGSDPFGNIHLAWHDDSQLISDPGIQYRKWNGTTQEWEQRMTVYGNSTGFRWSDITVDMRGNVHVTWDGTANILGASAINNDVDVFYRRLDASTGEWGPIIHVNDDDNDGDQDGSNVGSITSDIFENIYVFWDETGDQSGMGSGYDHDVFYRRLNSTSKIWEPRVLLSDDPLDSESSADPRACSDSLGNIHVTWGDGSDVDGAGPNFIDVFYRMWNSGTLSWGNTKSLTNDLNDMLRAYPPDISCDPFDNVALVWNDASGLLGSGSDQDVYLRLFDGNIFIPDYMPIEVSPSTSKHVLMDSDNVISAKVYNGGDDSSLWSTVAFYDAANPAPPLFSASVARLDRGERSQSFQYTWIAPSVPGTYDIVIEADYGDSITEVSEENNFYRIRFVVEEPPPPPSHPINLTTEVVSGDDVLLNWTMPNATSVDHYLIYRSVDQREFDFIAPLHDTSSDVDPLRTDWVDVNAAAPSSPREYYYVVRAVDWLGFKSVTSNTAGKWTRTFDRGMNAFSLPLEPYNDTNISWFSDNIPNTNFVRWMDQTGRWVTHYPSMGEGFNDSPAEMGRAYEISLSSYTTFTFCGYPGSMIRFHEGLGDSAAFRKSLAAEVEGNDVNLTWQSVPGADRYSVFRSETRNGLHDPTIVPLANTTETHWKDVGILGAGNSGHYYMVIPIDSTGKLGSSAYSVGVNAIVYSGGSDTFALPLKPMQNHPVDWYCDAIPYVAGMAYLIYGIWKFHAPQMPEGVYDLVAAQSDGYQISLEGSTKFTFIGY